MHYKKFTISKIVVGKPNFEIFALKLFCNIVFQALNILIINLIYVIIANKNASKIKHIKNHFWKSSLQKY
jgi:hypothetical protein